jgi:D-sedoheptulose 7-phosphate isomerase
MKNLSNYFFNKEKKELLNILNKLDINKIKNFNLLCTESIKAIKNGKKILFYGNGGSAADSQHLATELKVKYKKKRKALPSIALTNDISSITAIGNDYDFNDIFSRQIESIGCSGDIAIALTTSGNSKNLIRAAKVSKKLKLKTFCFSGNKGGLIKKYTDHNIIIPSNTTSIIQVCELFLGQIYCGILEDYFAKKMNKK